MAEETTETEKKPTFKSKFPVDSVSAYALSTYYDFVDQFHKTQKSMGGSPKPSEVIAEMSKGKRPEDVKKFHASFVFLKNCGMATDNKVCTRYEFAKEVENLKQDKADQLADKQEEVEKKRKASEGPAKRWKDATKQLWKGRGLYWGSIAIAAVAVAAVCFALPAIAGAIAGALAGAASIGAFVGSGILIGLAGVGLFKLAQWGLGKMMTAGAGRIKEAKAALEKDNHKLYKERQAALQDVAEASVESGLAADEFKDIAGLGRQFNMDDASRSVAMAYDPFGMDLHLTRLTGATYDSRYAAAQTAYREVVADAQKTSEVIAAQKDFVNAVSTIPSAEEMAVLAKMPTYVNDNLKLVDYREAEYNTIRDMFLGKWYDAAKDEATFDRNNLPTIFRSSEAELVAQINNIKSTYASKQDFVNARAEMDIFANFSTWDVVENTLGDTMSVDGVSAENRVLYLERAKQMYEQNWDIITNTQKPLTKAELEQAAADTFNAAINLKNIARFTEEEQRAADAKLQSDLKAMYPELGDDAILGLANIYKQGYGLLFEATINAPGDKRIKLNDSVVSEFNGFIASSKAKSVIGIMKKAGFDIKIRNAYIAAGMNLSDVVDKTAPAGPDKKKPDETKPDETKPDETKPDDVKPDETKPGEKKPDEKPDEEKPDDVKPDGEADAYSEQAMKMFGERLNLQPKDIKADAFKKLSPEYKDLMKSVIKIEGMKELIQDVFRDKDNLKFASDADIDRFLGIANIKVKADIDGKLSVFNTPKPSDLNAIEAKDKVGVLAAFLRGKDQPAEVLDMIADLGLMQLSDDAFAKMFRDYYCELEYGFILDELCERKIMGDTEIFAESKDINKIYNGWQEIQKYREAFEKYIAVNHSNPDALRKFAVLVACSITPEEIIADLDAAEDLTRIEKLTDTEEGRDVEPDPDATEEEESEEEPKDEKPEDEKPDGSKGKGDAEDEDASHR